MSFAVLLVSFWYRDELPKDINVHPDIMQEPSQTLIKRSEFSVNVDGNNYFIQPKYDYELYGLVVSYRHHNSDTGAHSRWGDHLNVADYCVIWSENVYGPLLAEIEFWNQEWTCYTKSDNREAFLRFDGSKLSNNHLITENNSIRDAIKEIGIGDQIRIKGWLSSYRSTDNLIRGTSTVRTDIGNGACETIYVNEVEILSDYTSPWRTAMYFSLVIFLLSLIYHFRRPYKTSH